MHKSAVSSHRHRRRRGFLLMDAMLALSLATMIILAGVSLMMSTASASYGSRQTTIAYNAARQAVENVRSFRGAVLANRTNATLMGSVPQMASLAQGSGTLNISTYRNNVKRVSVTINWVEGKRNRPRSITLTALVARGGSTP